MLRFSNLSHCSANRKRRGFSLLELAIVVGVTGLLFGGLWRLMASGNSQLREQSGADQINQLIAATRNFLTSQDGQTILTGLGANGVQQIFLPNVQVDAAGQAGCAANLIAQLAGSGTYCNFLPTGFWAGTTNAYNQTYQIFVRKDANPAGTVAQNYDFIVQTTGGDVIPETAGSRLSANIGANGGFVFSNPTCGPAATVNTTACGAFGSFVLNLGAGGPYGVISPGSGHIVTQNSSTLSAAANVPWLARTLMPGDAQVPPLFNTMDVALNMRAGGAPAPLNMGGNFLNMNIGATGNGGGTINLERGTISGPGLISIDNTAFANPAILLTKIAGGDLSPTMRIDNFVNQGFGLQINGLGPLAAQCDPAVAPNCNLALNVSGNALISGFLNAGTMRAGVFIYTSDARLKTEVKPISDALERVSHLNGYNFKWKKDGREDIGLIAQEVQKIFPEVVLNSGDKDNLGVEYGNLIAPVIEAIKQLKQKNEQLEQKITHQQKIIDRLSAQQIKND